MDKRTDYIDWDTCFMGLAQVMAQRSKDPSTQVGACIVSSDKKVLSMGYNGAPIGFDDDDMPWNRDGSFVDTKYAYVCHAEANAIINYSGSKKDFKDSTIYVDLFPCNECAKAIVQSGIKEVVYYSDKYCNTEGNIVSKKIFDNCGITYRQYEEKGKVLKIKI